MARIGGSPACDDGREPARLMATAGAGRIEGDRAEFITLSFWDSRQAIEGFAGQDIERAVYYPEDDKFLVDRDLTVRLFEIVN